jgi:hypothetical protein
MGLFDFLSSKKDLTDQWPAAKRFTPELDLRTMSLNSIALGDPAAALEALGRPDNPRPFKSGIFAYEESGVLVTLHDGKVDYFGVILDPQGNDAGFHLQAATVRLVRADGAASSVRPGALIDSMRQFLGGEVETEREADEILDTYRFGRRTLEVEAKPDGRIQWINLLM